MADIYLRHPIHGEKVEHNEAMAQMDKAHGWVEFDPTVKPEPIEPVVPPVPVPVVPPVAGTLPDFLKAPPASKKKPKPEG